MGSIAMLIFLNEQLIYRIRHAHWGSVFVGIVVLVLHLALSEL